MSDLKSIEKCVGAYRILWAIKWTGEVPVRVPDGMGDTKFSHMGPIEGTFHIIAATEELCLAGWASSTEGHIYKKVSHEKVLVVNAEVRI